MALKAVTPFLLPHHLAVERGQTGHTRGTRLAEVPFQVLVLL